VENLKQLVLEHLQITLSPMQEEAFRTYEKLLLEWNRKFNLTAITDPDEVRVKHFYDSLTCLKLIKENRFSLIDIGCGAGFPGLPLKIVRPEMKLVLVDAVRKKTDFCSAVVEALKLTDVTVIHARAEDIGRDPEHREKYDWAAARAVASLPVLAEYLLPLVKTGGCALAQKGGEPAEELAASANAIAILGGSPAETTSFKLPVRDDARTLVSIRKIKATPKKYPRKAGLPAKKPL
jgi:16S rRNA (guanine527-N7)-methyltransferase